MEPIYGEYECKLDSKGRFLLPSALLGLLREEDRNEFVIGRGMDQHLVLYPVRVWKEELAKIHSRNQYVKKNRAFARRFQAGAKPVRLDGSKRILVPKDLYEWAGMEKEIVLVGAYRTIELWSKPVYEAWLEEEAGEMEHLAEEVMGTAPDEPES